MIKALFRTLMMWGVAALYGLQVSFAILREVFRVGFGRVFSSKTFARPKCLDDPSLGTHGFLHLEEVRIHYVASGPEDRPLMLFLHGFPELWYSWRHQIKEFQKDYRVVAVDQRGYSESDKPNGIDAYTMKKLVADVKQIICALGYQNCILVGHDWGAAVAWAFGRQYPDMVDRLVIMNVPPSPVFQQLLTKDKTQFKLSWYIFFFQLPYLPELYLKQNSFEFIDNAFTGTKASGRGFLGDGAMQNPLSKEEAEAYKYTFSQTGAVTPPVNYYRAALRRPKGSIRYDMNYTMPVLLIWGYHDIALSPKIPDLVEAVKNPNITVRRIPEAGHFVQMDTPSKVNQIVREWLLAQS